MAKAVFEVNESSIATIEDMEQQLIQHLRTSGLRKPRETSLIDEIMLIRRERRKVCASLKGETLSFQEALANANKESEKNNLARVSELEMQLTTQQHQLDDFKREHLRQVRELKDRYSARLHGDIEELSRKYESKLRMLEGKIDELSSARSSKEKSDQEARVANHLEDHLSTLEKKYSSKMQK